MPEISIQRQCTELINLVDFEAWGEAEGPLPRQIDNVFFEQENLSAGNWECEPGTLNIDLNLTEFCHQLKGHWRLTSQSGLVTDVRAGDTWVFPKGWKGIGEVIATVHMVYIVIA